MAKGFTKGEDAHHPLDIREYLIQNPESTFFIQTEEGGPEGSGIHAGDMVAVDRSQTPKKGSLVIQVIEGEMELGYWEGKEEVTLWGVVIGLVRKY